LISIIVPVLNEADSIPALLKRLKGQHAEIIVVDGGSSDSSVALAESLGARVVLAGSASRPLQLNLGAAVAKHQILWFVHADTLPPMDGVELILQAFKANKKFGCFRFKFDSESRSLAANSYFTGWPFMICRGGDQSLFLEKSLFEKLGGYNETHVVMEDYDIIRRGRKLEKFHILRQQVLVSARKYEHNSYLRVNLANLIVFTSYYLGVPPHRLKSIYIKLIRHPKFGMPE
jgi:rSAM/selenodomain-associated transferase 2